MTEIGFLGGTFDPIHLGHIRLALDFQQSLALDRVELIPAGQPYHKAQTAITPTKHRVAMVQLAIQATPTLHLNPCDIQRTGPTYTIETLQSLRQQYGKQTAFWWLMGMDSFASLDQWHQWQRIFELSNLAVAMRPGYAIDQLPDVLQKEWQTRQASDFSNALASGTIRPLMLEPMAISSTDIRQRLAQHEHPEDLLSPKVLRYIAKHGLYQN